MELVKSFTLIRMTFLKDGGRFKKITRVDWDMKTMKYFPDSFVNHCLPHIFVSLVNMLICSLQKVVE
jgi:hypothetical protein